ncbi:Rad4-domain-containing protein [Hortaea werneckii]|nr:Rad4-domain-containing protein [Hortaea werneckii]KAI7096144.1 Rad4-domain-containing protein [Hortaea werneckii]KAI7234200.1 Rad4-domain-containing protein [Hortaea werneckii]KAI7302292.1 Rad4-domain-containing protein [Hortaea werneckii]KAI7392726.1 Rad4-domain-containing protein [Hortaea werneckii]
MPPYVSRKRQHSQTPDVTPSAKGRQPAKRSKTSVFDAADAPANRMNNAAENKKLLDELNDSEDDDSLSEADSDDFEDVPPSKRRKTSPAAAEDDGEEEDDDEMEWEDAIDQPGPMQDASRSEPEIGDISFTVKEDGSYTAPDAGVSVPGLGKKGPSKREKQVRIQTHCLHVQALLWHNTIRNSWLNDKQVQKVLVDGLPEGVKREVTRWREAMGMLTKEELDEKKRAAAAKNKSKKGKKGKKSGGGRDWNFEAEHQEQGVPNLSAGDPLLRLLRILTAYWRKRFTITAPGLRKQGYMSIRRLGEEIKDWEREKGDMEEHGERIASVNEFRTMANKCEGSRDVGAQLFCALLRGLGIDTRIVANLQPAGIGWSKAEEANAKKPKKDRKSAGKVEPEPEPEVEEVAPKAGKGENSTKQKPKAENPSRKSSRGNKAEPISLDDDDEDSPLSSAPADTEAEPVDVADDDESIVDVTPATPKKKPNKNFDRDLAYPNYWVEVCSPATHKVIPVDPIVLSTIASNDELLQTFEPRGKKAEVGKQVMAYTIAFSSDGTAKDVTIRYLKKHVWPGKTKGSRIMAEKVPIYNRKGKVRRYEEYDWFRTVMSLYDRPENKRTATDDLEEQTDLKPQQPAKEEGKEVEKESLQWYKQSADFVLEQHLRREEAIKPDAKPVKMFTQGKGEKAKEHPVFKRDDVLACKTVESWHKEGRALKEGEQPMKLVPMRAVTLVRKREMEDAQRETGEKLKQGLYSWDQTDWIIPPPIENGVIPKNAFGNMDVYVPTMVPKGAVHLPLKGSAKLCRKLGIDYAEACTGFEFGKQRAVPVLTGVVVAKDNEGMVRDAWRAEQEEVRRKEDTKRTGLALQWWRKMLLGLRVLERMRVEYADSAGKEEEFNPFVARARREGRDDSSGKFTGAHEPEEGTVGADTDVGGGGFFPEGHDEEEVPQQRRGPTERDEGPNKDGDGGFLVEEGQEDDAEPGGGFLIEETADDEKAPQTKIHAPIMPMSLQSAHKTAGDSESRADRSEEMEDPDENPASLPRKQTKASINKAPDGEEESELSKIEDSVANEAAGASSSDDDEPAHTTPPPSRRQKRNIQTSPKVIVTPRGKSGGSATLATRSRSSVGKGKASVRSKYFVPSESDDPSEHDEEAAEESEAEIVAPRKTTRRTRAKA